ncbi:F-box/kelch-repeat protein At5g42350-like [Phoenix dactylifera]|uniref:F-box/kelch-repeat protein At5g42350-like n=1 Tax=Phoenix dactylifera TaxID=42345 RepID=A0A8B7D3Z2_PHODC|nr:F-box/kelch-repeat protein At5g42350-like [Phoenix dactylifera]XP_008812690.1 F-box/kelch-repeat protein At5g42350-like [Phoenix dactylifera]XP_008812699.1 F-box/kelch-repeat protein At5g42350-like [Phoenix dactylifera]
MAGASSFNRSNSNSRTALLFDDLRKVCKISGIDAESSKDEASLQRDMEAMSVSEGRKKRNGHGGCSREEGVNSGPGPSGCLNLYVKGGGCRVCACEEFDADGKRRSSTMDECMPHKMAMGVERTGVECFSHGVRLWKKSLQKGKAIELCPPRSSAGTSLPDDVLELILVRLPFASLMAARCVCKKWRNLTTTPHFMQMRCESTHKSSWLFLFGIKRYGFDAGEIHALDVSSDRWHRISNDMLKERLLFSVANVGTDVYIVGGCSSLSSHSLSMERRIHKEVLVFSPITGSWRNAASMRSARLRPVLGVFEVSAGCSLFHTQPDRCDRFPLNSRMGGVSEVYEDPHRFSVRRRLRNAFYEDDNPWEPKEKPSKFIRRKMNKQPRFALIAVGGHGPWDEHLESGEAYDPLTDEWVEIATLPRDFGVVCSGAVCGGMFYVYSDADRLAGYDLEKGFWIAIQTLSTPPRLREYHPMLLSCRSRLFVFCVSWCERDGQLNRREKAVRKLWELHFPSQKWNEVSRHPDAPMDWNAVFISHENKIYGLEMFSIFGQVLDFLTACQVSDTELEWKRISGKHAAHEADASSCTTKSMVVLHL